MADWVHCNTCFHQPGDGRKFSLTNCGHIFCANCTEQSTKPKCRMCGVSCTTIQLSSKMKPDVEIFFTDPGDIVKKRDKQLLQVLEFQKNHRQRFTQYRREKLAKQENAITRSQKSSAHSLDLEREVILLREENTYLKKLLMSGKSSFSNSWTASGSDRSTPTSRSNQLRDQNVAGVSLSPQNSQYSSMQVKSRHVRPIDLVKQTSSQKTPESATMRTDSPSTQGRITVRTPPSGGRMGHIPGTPVPAPYYGSTGTTPHIPLDGTVSPSYSSPMALSPALRSHISQHPSTSQSCSSRPQSNLQQLRQIQLPRTQ